MGGTVFAFDLDGTVTASEILPVLARELDLVEELELLTSLTLSGAIPFAASFKLRFHILKSLPLPVVRDIVASVPLDPDIEAFIHERRAQCRIVTGNLDVWIEPVVRRLGCEAYCSRSAVRGDQLVIAEILDKGLAVRDLKQRHGRVVAVGESANDIPMFERADVGVAYGGVHAPVPDILRLADHVAHDGKELCRLLRELI